jgi:hypothetical protein
MSYWRCLFNFGVKKCRIEGVCLILVLRNVVLKVFVTQQRIMIHPRQAYRAISKMYKRGGIPAQGRESLHSLVSTRTATWPAGDSLGCLLRYRRSFYEHLLWHRVWRAWLSRLLAELPWGSRYPGAARREASCHHVYGAWWSMTYWPGSVAVAYLCKDTQMICVFLR